jgi:hypothetical protein
MKLPRGLVLLGTLWIFAAWAICIGVRPPIQPSIASYLPGIRIFLAAIAVGLCVAWPMVRLSEPASRAPALQILVDFITLGLLLHVVLWPLRLATNWSPARMGLIDLLLFSWTAIVAAVLACTIASRSPLERVVSMMVILVIALLGPLACVASARLGWPLPPDWLDGPIMSVLKAAHGGGAAPDGLAWKGAVVVGAAAAATWAVVLLLHLADPERGRDASAKAR